MRTTLTVRAPTLLTSLAVLLASSACPPASGPGSPAPRPLPQVSGAILLDFPAAWAPRGEPPLSATIVGYQPTRATLEGSTARFEGLARVGELSLVQSCPSFGPCVWAPVWRLTDQPLCVALTGDTPTVETDCAVIPPEQNGTTEWSATSSDGWPTAFTPGAQWLTAHAGAPPLPQPVEAWSFATRVPAVPSEYDELWPGVAWLTNNRRFTRGAVTQPWSGRERPTDFFWRFEDAVAGVGFALPEASVRHLWAFDQNATPTAQWLSHGGAVHELTDVDVNGARVRRVLDPLGDARVRPLAVAHDEASTVALVALDDEEARAATAELFSAFAGQYRPHRHLRLALVRRGAPPEAPAPGPAPEPMQTWATSERNVLVCLSTPVEPPEPGAITGLDGVEVTSVTAFQEVPHCLALGVRGVTRGLGGTLVLDGLVSRRGARSGRTRASFLPPLRLEDSAWEFAFRPTASWSPLGLGASWAAVGLSVLIDRERGLVERLPPLGSPLQQTSLFASFTGHAWFDSNWNLSVVTGDGLRRVGDSEALSGGGVSSYVHLGDGSVLARTNTRTYVRIFPDAGTEPFPLPGEATRVHGSFLDEVALLVAVDGGTARLGPGGVLGPERYPPLGVDHLGEAALFRVGATLYRCDAHLYQATPAALDGGVGRWEQAAPEACLAWGVSRGADGTVWLGPRAVREDRVTTYDWPLVDRYRHVRVEGDDVTFHEAVGNLGLKGSYLRAPLRELLEVGDGMP